MEWYVRFARVKLAYEGRLKAAFDDLYLVIVSPKGFCLIKHDIVRVGAQGKATAVSGHMIKDDKGTWKHRNRLLGRWGEILKLRKRGGRAAAWSIQRHSDKWV